MGTPVAGPKQIISLYLGSRYKDQFIIKNTSIEPTVNKWLNTNFWKLTAVIVYCASLFYFEGWNYLLTLINMSITSWSLYLDVPNTWMLNEAIFKGPVLSTRYAEHCQHKLNTREQRKPNWATMISFHYTILVNVLIVIESLTDYI